MEQLFIILRLDLTDQAPDGPGWYLQSILDGTPVFDPVGISPLAAQEAAIALQKAMQSTEGELSNVSLPQIVQSGSKLIEEHLRKELQEAEAAAAKVAKIRRRLSRLTEGQS